MNTQQVVELVTDAVIDAVREALPGMIEKNVAQLRAELAPALAKLETALDAQRDETQRRITECEAGFATRAINQADALANSLAGVESRALESVRDQVARAVSAIPSLAGPAGPPGPPGRDASMTPPVHWQPDTTYRAGAVVMHRGGLWYANQDTAAPPGSDVSGYSLMFDGAQLQAFEHDADGVLVAVYEHASGKVRKVSTGERALAYQGVFDQDASYRRNDCVTAGGSLWVCKADQSAGARPGTDQGARAWQLAVKCGRDGRDGAPGARGERGERGDTGPPGAAAAPAPKRKANGAHV